VDASSQGSDYFIVVPVLDEAAALPALLDELRGLDLLGRTLFVDNGSRDGSPGLIAAARGAHAVVFMEADGTDDPAQARHLVGPVLAGVADLVVGSRSKAVLGASAGRMPVHQRLGNAWLAFALRVLFGLRLRDEGPFRAVSLGLLTRLCLEERAYAFPTEMAVKAGLLGARIVTRETRYRPRAGRSKIAGTWRGTFGAVRDILWCLLRLRLLGFQSRE
jgi:hypothetical protein